VSPVVVPRMPVISRFAFPRPRNNPSRPNNPIHPQFPLPPLLVSPLLRPAGLSEIPFWLGVCESAEALALVSFVSGFAELPASVEGLGEELGVPFEFAPEFGFAVLDDVLLFWLGVGVAVSVGDVEVLAFECLWPALELVLDVCAAATPIASSSVSVKI
jgi:hypothetical protein